MGCKKDITDKIDITKHKWELQYVETNNKKLEPKNKDYHRDEAYDLTFSTDSTSTLQTSSTFSLHTSVNVAEGTHEIHQKGELSVYSYTAITEVATIDEETKKLDKNLIRVFNEVTTYEVFGGLNKTLVFDGPEGEVKFKKE